MHAVLVLLEEGEGRVEKGEGGEVYGLNGPGEDVTREDPSWAVDAS